MVGNDIVDLYEAKKASDWKRPRFLSKLFSVKEKEYISNSTDAFAMVWQLWTMKEAAYKLYIQGVSGRFYNPKSFKCTIEENFGYVQFQNFKCFTQTQTNSNYILSEARLDLQSNIKSEVLVLRGNHHNERLLHLKNHLNLVIEHDPSFGYKGFFGKTKTGLPYVSFGDCIQLISLSHHGRFGAYVLS